MNYTNILDVYGGGGKVLGVTYLFLFYLGMIFNKYKVFHINNRMKSVLIFIVSAIASFCWWRGICSGLQPVIDSKFPLGDGFNPPSFTFGFYAVLMMFSCFGFLLYVHGTT